MEQITVRKASLSDVEKLFQFEQGVINAERPFDSTLQDGHIHYYDLKKMLSDPLVEIAVAISGDEIVGCGYARIENAKKPFFKYQQHAYLGFMYVDPAHRGKGVNKRIIEALKQWSLSQNITEMRLEVYNGNTDAIKAYEKAGFTRHIIEMRMGLTED